MLTFQYKFVVLFCCFNWIFKKDVVFVCLGVFFVLFEGEKFPCLFLTLSISLTLSFALSLGGV